MTNNSVELAYVDQGYTGENAASAAEEHGIRFSVVKHPMAKRGLRPAAKTMGDRKKLRLGCTLPKTRTRLRTPRYNLKGFHYIAFACIMIARRKVQWAQI